MTQQVHTDRFGEALPGIQGEKRCDPDKQPGRRTSRNIPRRSYPSDIRDEQWAELENCIPPERGSGRHRTTDPREVINALNYRWQTGCTWRMLPHDLPPWTTVYNYFQRWQLDGTLRQIREVLIRPASRPASQSGERSQPGRGANMRNEKSGCLRANPSQGRDFTQSHRAADHSSVKPDSTVTSPASERRD